MGLFILLLMGGLVAGMSTLMGDEDADEDTPQAASSEEVTRDGDELRGTSGDDSIMASAQDDRIFSGPGEDTVRGGRGRDLISDAMADQGQRIPNDSDDLYYGGGGNDTLYSSGGRDALHGGTGDDVIYATEDFPARGQAQDTLWGGYGDDTLVGDAGDVLYGGVGKDVFAAVVRENADEMVVIEDYQPGETISVEILDPALLPLAEQDHYDVRAHRGGQMISVRGQDLVFVKNTSFEELDEGTLQVLDVRR